MAYEIPEFLESSLAKPAAILGGAVSGQGTAELLARIGVDAVIYDRKGGGAEPTFSEDDARGHGLVVFSPGFSSDHPWIRTASDAGCICLGELDFASLFWKGSIIAVTGTNGKTTLTEFLAHALNKAGRSAFATGNVGYPVSRLVQQEFPEEAIAVCEISSFQAESLQHLTPEATLWTNLAEDHLERHASMATYFDAKARLVGRTKSGMCWAGNSVAEWAGRCGRSLNGVNVVDMSALQADPRLEGTPFATLPQRENFALALAYWRHAGLDEKILHAAASTFRLGRHRLARVAEVGGVTFWNDSKATNFHAVIGALGNFESPVHWIGGGRSKGGDVNAFVREISGRVARAYLIGETSDELAGSAAATGMPVVQCADLLDAVSRAWHDAKPGDHVLFSPGFASLDQFKSYEDRGDQFEAFVAKLSTSTVTL